MRGRSRFLVLAPTALFILALLVLAIGRELAPGRGSRRAPPSRPTSGPTARVRSTLPPTPAPSRPPATTTPSPTVMPTLTPRQPTAALPLPSTQAENVELVGYVDGSIADLYIQEDYLYLGIGYKFEIWDIRVPARPRKVGEMPLRVGRIHVAGDYAYVLDHDGDLYIVDVSVPATPRAVGWYETSAIDVTVVGTYAYLVKNKYLSIIDVSTPRKPFEVGIYDMRELGWSVTVLDNYAYVSLSQSGLLIIDVSNPAAPSRAGLYEQCRDSFMNKLIAAGNWAYLVGGTSGCVLDISNPAVPTHLWRWPDSDYSVWDIVIAGDYAFISDKWSHLYALDISNPQAPNTLVSVPLKDVRAIEMAGDHVYAADWNGLHVIDVSDPANMTEVHVHPTLEANGRIIDVGSNLYTAHIKLYSSHLWGGLSTIDVADPASPTVTRHHPLGLVSTEIDMAISRGTAYLVSGFRGRGDFHETGQLHLSNLWMPLPVDLSGTFYLHGIPSERPSEWYGLATGVAQAGRYVYVAFSSYNDKGVAKADLGVINVSNPLFPRALGRTSLGSEVPGTGEAVQVSRGYAYVAAGTGGLWIVDVSNPRAPAEAACVAAAAPAQDVALMGHYAYVAAGGAGLHVIDVSTPEAPVKIGSVALPGEAVGLDAVGGYVYVAAGDAGLRVIDVFDPASPTEVGFYDPAGRLVSVRVGAGYRHVYTGGDVGLLVLQLTVK